MLSRYVCTYVSTKCSFYSILVGTNEGKEAAFAAFAYAAQGAHEFAKHFTWADILQGLSIFVNSVFLVYDLKKFLELREAKKTWENGEKSEILKQEKFSDVKELRDIILKIRDQIMEA